MMVSKNGRAANELLRPGTLDEAHALLAADPAIRLLGGGTAVVPDAREGRGRGRWLTTTSIRGLDAVTVDERGYLHIGAAATLRDIETHPAVRTGWPSLAAALAAIAGPAVRNAATIGGSLASGAASPDPCVALVALGARADTNTAKDIGLVDLPTALEHERPAFIERVSVPPATDAGWGHERFTVRGAADQPFVIAAVTVSPEATRIAVAAGEPRPLRLTATERAIEVGDDWQPVLDGEIASMRPRDSDRGSGRYRARVLRAMTDRAIERAIEIAMGTTRA